MPRTKYKNKSKKKNSEKDEIITERLREYDIASEQFLNSLNTRYDRICDDFLSELTLLKTRFQKKFLDTTLGEIFNSANQNPTNSIRSNQNTKHIKTEKPFFPTPLILHSQRSKEDEGYMTEESNKGSIRNLPIMNKPILRLYCSVKATRRRSRSACGNLRGNKNKNLDKAYSADRSPLLLEKYSSHSPAICRWPKPGETIISLAGSPIVTPMTPASVANVNIPIRNGMVSLKPKKIKDIDQNIIQDIEPETLLQIKQLQSNLSYIMRFAEKPDEYLNMK